MPPRDEDLARTGVGSVTVSLPDLEPCMGLAAACARFSAHLAYTPEVYAAMNDGATRALTEIQAILYRLAHSSPEPEPTPGPTEQG